MAMAWLKHVGPRLVLVLVLALYTLGFSVASLVWAVMLRSKFENLQVNMVGDPEKVFIDNCMRDFEHLPTSDDTYIKQRRECAKELLRKDRFRWLPVIRLTVDERICDQKELCANGDPGQCLDENEYGDATYKPGDVTSCYDLIKQAKNEQGSRRRAELEDEVEAKCTYTGRWKDYANQVHLEYCINKHFRTGICANHLRTSCPTDATDDSCCPVAPHYIGEDGVETQTRPDQYKCQQSPTVGLYCQHLNYLTEGNATTGDMGYDCTETTCSSFSWCRDFADIPGLCLGDACQEYRRSLAYAAALITTAVLGIVFDLADLFVLVRHPKAGWPKAFSNMAGAAVKLVGFFLCLTGGIKEFADEAFEQRCWNDSGSALVKDSKGRVDAFRLTVLLAAAGSLVLAPLSARWGGHFRVVPYARMGYEP